MDLESERQLAPLRPDDVLADGRHRPDDRLQSIPAFLLADVPADSALRRSLEALVRLIEAQVPTMRASVLLLDDDGVSLRHGAAPGLPEAFSRAIDGAHIGPVAGSCGTAAWRGEQVIVGDIATDPLWAEYRALALPHGLRACWSTPILDGERRVLGTFAMYYGEPREPNDFEMSLTRTATLLASNIIVRARSERALRRGAEELRTRAVAAERAARALRESEAQLRAARAEAEEASQAKARFIATMSHELRTPLNAIGGYATLMLDGIPTPPSDGQRNYLERILRGQRHLLGLIDTVLTHAKLEADRMTYRVENVHVSELLEVVETLSTPQLNAKGIAWDCSRCDGRLLVRGDRQKIVQILLNLVSNAIKFTPESGSIEVSTAIPAPGQVALAVRDTGVGMSAEQVATVFEPYVQFDNRLTRTEHGTGLGTAISRQLARGMGGDLTVESEAGAGTTFILRLQLDAPPS